MRPPRVLAVVAVLAVSLLGGLLGLTLLDDGAGPGLAEGFGDGQRGLCEARAAARQGRGPQARRLFIDVSHQPLHDLARDLLADDPVLAGRLLRVKQRVEALLETGPADVSALGPELDQLLDVTRTAMGAGPCES